MSLIYDYLKINGKSGSEKDSDVEIPPTLKRRDTNRIKTRSILLILGSCLIGSLFVFLHMRRLPCRQQKSLLTKKHFFCRRQKNP
ncbi:MAG: hypothetical protein AMJ60_10130 [Desulfobacterales bacterium SG8_35]|nr:MAG: hypothetical protein AMJ60_10130 [Desulfobacterales bacterium SG8_35]